MTSTPWDTQEIGIAPLVIAVAVAGKWEAAI
jgi:hypothetical protein